MMCWPAARACYQRRVTAAAGYPAAGLVKGSEDLPAERNLAHGLSAVGAFQQRSAEVTFQAVDLGDQGRLLKLAELSPEHGPGAARDSRSNSQLPYALSGELVHDQEGFAQLIERQFDPEVVDLAGCIRVRTNTSRDEAAPPLIE